MKYNTTKRGPFLHIFFGILILSLAVGFGVSAKESPDQFGYHALKIDGKYVSTAICIEEQNKFFQRWHTNSVMLRKTDEERNDLLLDEIINRVIIEDYLYHQTQVKVTSQDVDNYIKRYIKARYPNPEDMAAFLEGSNYGTEANLKVQIKLYLLKLKCFSKIAKEMGLSIPAAELQEKYQKHIADNYMVTARHILIHGDDPAKSKERAQDVYRQLKNGADFAKLALEYSNDEQTRQAGGILQPFAKGVSAPEVDQNVFNAKPRTLVPPFETSLGWEIVFVEKFQNFSHPKAEYADMLLLEKFGDSEPYNKWLAGVKAKKTIEILDSAFKAYRFYRDRKYNPAGALYEKLYAEKKNELYLTRAIDSYQLAKNWPALIKLGQQGMSKYPAKVSYYLNKAEGLYRTEKTKDALALLKKAEKMSKDNIYYSGLVIEMYNKLGLKKDADRFREQAGLKY
ncbi:MAG TPA: peptidylprolyl isomerase [Bacillota bacterium]|nr:peptidylprolyl isomerase [Bacillota bacterium]